MPSVVIADTEISFTVHRGRESGLVQIPAAGPDGEDCVFVRVHSGMVVEAVSWTATRRGDHPVIPSPYGPDCIFGLNDDMIWIRSEETAIVPTPTGDSQGRKIYSMSGTHYYGRKRVPKQGKLLDLRLGKLPFDNGLASANTFPKENYKTGFIDSTKDVDVPLLNPIQGP